MCDTEENKLDNFFDCPQPHQRILLKEKKQVS